MPRFRALLIYLLLLLPVSSLDAAETKAPFSFHQIKVRAADGSSCELSLVRFDAAVVEFKVISNGRDFKQPAYASLKEALVSNECFAGINGGFFELDPFSPIGYLVVDGEVLSKRPDKSWMHGLVMVENGKMQLDDMDVLLPEVKPEQALQSGPCLIEAGAIDSYLLPGQRARRSFIVRGSSEGWMIGVSSRICLFDLAEVLLSPPVKELIQVQYALNLDGGSSSGMYLEQSGKTLFYQKTARVQNFIGIALKQTENTANE
ncbi:MAG: phosphodiester glycosidase family protein [Verrucomicrobiota bacterium]